MSRYLTNPLIFNGLLFVALVLVFGLAERRWRARPIPWRSVLVADIAATLFYVVIVAQAAQFLNRWIAVRGPWPALLGEWPLWARLVLYLVVADFGAYWIHRLVHLRPFWRVHRWHHLPTRMYWLAGTRSSILQQTLFNLPYIFASPLLDVSPWWIASGLFALMAVTNSWMHMNVRWQLGWLDWFLVTPRSHEIHHSDRPEHYQSNFGVLLSVWDRLFGTFCSPRQVDASALRFGISDKVPLARLTIGL
ncbi:sterol desaturase family protein [Variovorax sp. N23]|uniref:sterol desaturase family protein n=1 Tax=Variovorax sp. N23 TaxID=2980555 RepID=UPI0021C94CC4|nr:sterol desaturase family protein [Variovorax sp. N23]MCU4117810.1 sterol desaturase family protein [Variovorax sp. N23]